MQVLGVIRAEGFLLGEVGGETALVEDGGGLVLGEGGAFFPAGTARLLGEVTGDVEFLEVAIGPTVEGALLCLAE